MAMNKVYNKKDLTSFKDVFLEVYILYRKGWWEEGLNWVKHQHIIWKFLAIVFRDHDNTNNQ